MKSFRIIFLFFGMLLALPKANAQYQGSIIGFEVVGNSHLVVNQQASSTTFKVKISVSRILNGSTYYPFKMNFKLGIEYGELFSTVYTITDSDFTSGQGGTSKEFSATIANTKLPDGRKLQAYYNNPSNNNPNYTNSNLLVTIFNPPPVVEVPQISNNTITLQYNPVVGSEINIAGSNPSGGTGNYISEWQIKQENGNYSLVGSNIANMSIGSLKFLNKVLDGSTIRRKITSGSKVSYSNEILLKRESRVTFTVQKTPVFDASNQLVGNTMKIVLGESSPNITFSILLIGPDGDDPVWLTPNGANEFYVARDFLGVAIYSSNGIDAGIVPTWVSGSDSYIYNY